MREKIIESLKSKLNRRVWESWFGTFDVKEIGADYVVFQVGNLFIRDWLEKKYGALISKTLRELFGKQMNFQIDYAPAQSQEESEQDEPLVKKRPLVLTPLNPILTFENFVVGPSNMFAYSTSIEVAKNPGKYNPLFLHGGVGLGKTHLVQAIGHYLFKNEPDLRVIYLTSERFLNELVDSIKKNKVQEFRERFRNKVDVLLLDDVQFLIGKSGIQTELFHTFNELYNAGKQIVVCSDRDPQQLEKFQDRLVSRFQMGVVAKIDKPDEETCFKIANRMVQLEGGRLQEDVLRLVATHFSDNLRRLRGALVKLIMYQQISNETVDLQKAAELLSVASFETKKVLPEEKLIDALCKVFGVTQQEILGKGRKQIVINARQIGMFVAKNHFGLSLRQVAELFGRSHPTVSHTIQKVEELLSSGNIVVKNQIDQLMKYMTDRVSNQSI
ncbi:MAG TPA: chromosomal replication initiator protein DnaA [Pseudothermotoga sp.]|nr:chromosomal replication initiator protein DnaA [Pseudothermotoga sp.]HOK84355.1 chromosomal replication initiator protein DnaA [Pseudothermotoga sp.]HPP70767.1 chromosomal replication initiator protein DnaA [Pseudothermotoga sp.]